MSDAKRGHVKSGNTAGGFVVVDNRRARTIPIQQPYASNKPHDFVLASNVLEGVAAARGDFEQHLWNFPLKKVRYTMPTTTLQSYNLLAWKFEGTDSPCVSVPSQKQKKNKKTETRAVQGVQTFGRRISD